MKNRWKKRSGCSKSWLIAEATHWEGGVTKTAVHHKFLNPKPKGKQFEKGLGYCWVQARAHLKTRKGPKRKLIQTL